MLFRSTEEELNTMNKLINEIMPINEEKELYLQILSTVLDGKCLEKFKIFNGSGGNGKTTLMNQINEIMKSTGHQVGPLGLYQALTEFRQLYFLSKADKYCNCVAEIKSVLAGEEYRFKSWYDNKTIIECPKGNSPGIIASTNDLSCFKKDSGLESRIIVINMTHKFV